MSRETKAPTTGMAVPRCGHTSAASDLSVIDMTPVATDDSTSHLWRFIAPTTTEDELYNVILRGMLRMRQDFALTHDAARLHNDLTQLAEEIERVARAVG